MKIDGKEYRTIWFENNIVKIIDQTKLPHQFIIKELKKVKDAINSIPITNEKKLESKKEFDEFNLALSNDLNTSVALSQIISLSKKKMNALSTVHMMLS